MSNTQCVMQATEKQSDFTVRCFFSLILHPSPLQNQRWNAMEEERKGRSRRWWRQRDKHNSVLLSIPLSQFVKDEVEVRRLSRLGIAPLRILVSKWASDLWCNSGPGPSPLEYMCVELNWVESSLFSLPLCTFCLSCHLHSLPSVFSGKWNHKPDVLWHKVLWTIWPCAPSPEG